MKVVAGVEVHVYARHFVEWKPLLIVIFKFLNIAMVPLTTAPYELPTENRSAN